MATVTVFTAARMQAIEDNAIVDGEIDGSGHLILETFAGTPIDAGPVVAAAGTPFVGQYTTAGRPAAATMNGKIYWDTDDAYFGISNGSTWSNLLEGAFVGQYTTANRPDATTNLGRVIWDITVGSFFTSDGVTWDEVLMGGGGGSGDVSSTDTDASTWDWVLTLASPLTLDDTKLPTWSKTRSYVDGLSLPAQIASTDTSKLDVYTVDGITYLDVTSVGGGSSGSFESDVFEVIDNIDNTKVLNFSVAGLTPGIPRLFGWPDGNGIVLTDVSSADIANKKLATAAGFGSLKFGKFADQMIGGIDWAWADLVPPTNTFVVAGGPAAIGSIVSYHNGANSTTPTPVGTNVEIFRAAGRAMRSNNIFASTDMARFSIFTREAPSATAQGADIRLGVVRVGSTTLENLLGIQGGADASTGGTVSVRNQLVVGAGDVTTAPATGYAIESKSDPIGYGVGAGGAVTQLTDKSTAVTINEASGKITTHNASLANNAAISFTVNNSQVGVNDTIICCLSSGTTGLHNFYISAVAAGSFQLTIRNISGGALAESLVFNFSVIKGAVT